MKKNILFLIFFLSMLITNSQQVNYLDFKQYFKNKTMRMDYFHTGNSADEHFAVDRILSDGPWSGSKNVLLDELNLGPYFYEIYDNETGKIIFSRGFASIFGEWQTIPDAKEHWGTFHESIRFPWPLRAVKLVMKKRNYKNEFVEIWSTEIDASKRAVNPSDIISKYKTWTYMENGPTTEKLDIVILGDGYTSDEMDKFHKDIERLTEKLFAEEPFKTRRSDFNIRAVETPAEESGVNRPHHGIFKRSPLSVSYSSFDSQRYALAYDNRTIRDVASAVPYDFMYILINEQTYGGGGIFHLYATVSADNKYSDYIFIHELGHHLAGLADEYYSSSVSYELPSVSVEPWEPNLTALFDKENLKWKKLVEDDTPIPTSWNKETFDKQAIETQRERQKLRSQNVTEGVMEKFFDNQKENETEMIAKMKYTGKTGAFEGASYHQFGLYRPYTDCIMFTRNKNSFCPVCQAAINKVIDQYTK
ncbi:MAG: hypothetical protein JEY97_09415 [Bacteroidales bacterium]|nr:hypothetical protein [Bacteroidales bacterium]